MSVTAIRWVLWVSLVLLLPLPLQLLELGWVPAFFGLNVLFSTLLLPAASPEGAMLMLAPQVAVAVLLNWLLADCYLRISAPWPAKLRGSIMGIAVLTGLVLAATFRVYQLPFPTEAAAVTFFQLYQ
jgi:hypothetical protein